MSLSATVAWLVAALAAAAYLLIATTIAAYGDRVAARRFTRRSENGNRAEQSAPIYLASHTLVLGRALQAAALLSGALSLFTALDNSFGRRGPDSAELAASGLLTAGGAAALQLAAWAVAARRPEMARRLMAPVAGVLHIASGFRWLLWVGRLSRLSDSDAPPPSTSDEAFSAALKENLDLLEGASIPVEHGELRMIRSILRMDTVKVREIMRPRVDMVMASANWTVEEMTAHMSAGSHNKAPVYDGAVDNIVGVVYARDLLLAAHRDGEGRMTTVRELARPPLFVPESQNLERLLREFQEKRTGIAIVVDEYGGVSGLVTRTDLVEEIVGKLVDEFDRDEPDLQRTSEREAVVDGRVSVDELNQAMGTTIEASGFDTVGGLVYRELGKVPVAGESVRVDGLTITVQSTAGRRIRQVRVEKRSSGPGTKAVA